MTLIDYIKQHHNGVQRRFCEVHELLTQVVNRWFTQKGRPYVFEYTDVETGDTVTSVFREVVELNRKGEGAGE